MNCACMFSSDYSLQYLVQELLQTFTGRLRIKIYLVWPGHYIILAQKVHVTETAAPSTDEGR